MTTSRVSGACLCGAVRFELTLPTMFCAHCHCTMCRRAHGAGYVTWVGAFKEGFRVVAGAERLVRYRSSDHGTRSFCGTCGSSLFFESTLYPGRIDVPLANLEGDAELPPQGHVFYDNRAPWVCIGDDLPRLGGPTGMEPL